MQGVWLHLESMVQTLCFWRDHPDLIKQNEGEVCSCLSRFSLLMTLAPDASIINLDPNIFSLYQELLTRVCRHSPVSQLTPSLSLPGGHSCRFPAWSLPGEEVAMLLQLTHLHLSPHQQVFMPIDWLFLLIHDHDYHRHRSLRRYLLKIVDYPLIMSLISSLNPSQRWKFRQDTREVEDDDPDPVSSYVPEVNDPILLIQHPMYPHSTLVQIPMPPSLFNEMMDLSRSMLRHFSTSATLPPLSCLLNSDWPHRVMTVNSSPPIASSSHGPTTFRVSMEPGHWIDIPIHEVLHRSDLMISILEKK